MDIKNEVMELINNNISKLTTEVQFDTEEILSFIEVPTDSEMGDYAFPCFRFSKVLKKAPNMIAEEFATIINENNHSKFITKVINRSGYINFFIDKPVFIKLVIENILEKDELYGSSEIGKDKTIVIDYFAANVAKHFHVGHLRNIAIGNTLNRVLKTIGYQTVTINYLGDYGTQFGKLIVAYKKWGNKQLVEEHGIQGLVDLYVKFHEEANNNKDLEEEARAWFTKIEQGDTEAVDLWNWFKEISMKEIYEICELLDLGFDSYNGEAFYNDKTKDLIEELKQKNLLIESEGANIVDLSESNMPPCLITKKDGSTIYATRDLASVKYRKDTYHFDKAIYITAYEQKLHFAQWFKVIEKMGYEWVNDLIHVAYGMVALDTGKMSTRHGNVVLLRDLLEDSIKKAKEIIDEKNPNLSNKEEVAKMVGIGAMLFSMIYTSNIKDMTFSANKAISFEGETAPYIQYTHARTCSLLRKAKEGQIEFEKENLDFSAENISNDTAVSQVISNGTAVPQLMDNETVFELCKALYEFPNKILEVATRYEPYILARNLVEISSLFNKFYNENQILVEDKQIRNFRLALVSCVRLVIKKGLGLLGIKAPVEM